MDPIFIDSRLVAATVYGDLARVSREGETELTAGVNRIAWPDLPAEIDPADVQVETDHGRVRSVETEPVPVPSAATEEHPSDQLQADLHRWVAAQEALRSEIELLDHVLPPRDGASAPLRPDLFMQGLNAIIERRRSALAELRAAAAAHAETARALERALAQNRDRTVTHRKTLMVSVDAPSTVRARLRVTYASGWATWRPLYHLQLSPGADQVEIVRYGDVWQDTGEDWSQVSLRLSTAEPQIGLRLPKVKPWVLKVGASLDDDMKALYRNAAPRPPQPAPATGALEPPPPAPQAIASPTPTHEVTGSFTPSDDFDEYATQFDEDGVFAEATSPGLAASRALPAAAIGAIDANPMSPSPLSAPVSTSAPPPAGPDRSRLVREPRPREASGGIDVELNVARPFDANSGADRHRVQLGRRTYPLELWYVLRPGLRDHAFGQAEIINEDADPILAGPTSLFVGNAFHGHTRLATTPGRGKLTLDLGAETGIKCARRSETQVRREGLLTKDEVHAVEVTVEIESYLATPVKLHVQDQVPVATTTQVRVKLMNTSPADAELDDATGLLSFSTVVSPHSKTELSFVYEISAPVGFRLSQGLADEVLP